MDDYYQILGVSKTASSEEIKKRFFFLAKAYHPDRFSDDASKSEALKEMQKVNQAYEVLSNPEKRRRYDQGSREDSPSTSYQATNNYSPPKNDNSVLFDYLVSLVEKWRVQIGFPLPDGPLENIRREFTYSVIHFFTDIYQPADANKILEETKRTNEAVLMLVQINIALGMQNRHGGVENNFTLEELTKASTLPVRSVLTNAIKYLSSQKKDVSSRKKEDIANIAKSSLNLCKLVQSRAETLWKPTNDPQPDQSNYAPPQNETRRSLDYCQACGKNFPTKKITFHKNIGLLIMRINRTATGNFCVYCIEKFFWEYTAITLYLGWWGVISFFTTPFNLLINFFNYLRTLNMKPGKLVLWRIAWVSKVFVLLGVLIISWLLGDYFFQMPTSNSQTVQTPVYATPIPVRTSTAVPKIAQLPIPTSTPKLTLRPTLTKTAVLASTAIPVNLYGLKCYKWDQVTAELVNTPTKICVYGEVIDAYYENNQTFTIIFNKFSKDSNKGFRIMVFGGDFYTDILGKCMIVYGYVQTLDGAVYIEPDGSLYYCDSYVQSTTDINIPGLNNFRP